VKYAWIKDHQNEFTVSSMCLFLKVSRSCFYDWLKRPKTEREKENEALLILLKRLFKEGRGNYGTRRLKRKLADLGLYGQSASDWSFDEACWINL